MVVERFNEFECYFWLKEEILGVHRGDMRIMSNDIKGERIDGYARQVKEWW